MGGYIGEVGGWVEWVLMGGRHWRWGKGGKDE